MALLSYREGIRQIQSSCGVVGAVGDECFLREQVRIRASSLHQGLEVVKKDCEELSSEDEIFEELKSQDLFSSKKIYILSNFTKIKNLNRFYERQFPNVIVLDSEKPSKSKQYEDLKARIPVIDCSKPKPWEAESEGLSRILGYLKVRGYSITEEAALSLYSRVGFDLYKLVSEMNKLLIYKQDSDVKAISEQDIGDVCVKGQVVNVFDVIDHVIDGEKEKALTKLSTALKKDPNCSVLFISLWFNHLEALLMLKTSSKSAAELAPHIKMPPSLISKKLKVQAQKVGARDIVQAMEFLLDVDKKMRQGFFDTKFYLEKFVISFPS